MSCLCVSSYRVIWAVLWLVLQSVQKVAAEKNEAKNFVVTRISEMAGVIFLKFGMKTPLPGGHLCS